MFLTIVKYDLTIIIYAHFNDKLVLIIVLQYRPTIVNYDFTAITIINYDRKIFIVQATGVFGTSTDSLYFDGKAWISEPDRKKSNQNRGLYHKTYYGCNLRFL